MLAINGLKGIAPRVARPPGEGTPRRRIAVAAATNDSLFGFDLNALIEESAKPIIKASPSAEPAAPELPNLDLPSVEVPQVEIPQPETLNVEIPPVETPKLELPKVEMPKVELPKVEMPKAEMPKVELPKVELPPKIELELPKPAPPQVSVPEPSTGSIFTSRGGSTPAVDAPPPSSARTLPSLDDLKMELNAVDAEKAKTAAKEPFSFENPFAAKPSAPALPAEPKAASVAPPELPEVEMPKLESPLQAVPTEPPQVSDTPLEMPKFEIPTVEMPKFELPKFELPAKVAKPEPVPAPEPPTLELPSLDLPAEVVPQEPPQVSEIPLEMPKLELPSKVLKPETPVPTEPAPSFEMPKLEAPKAEMPKLEMPKFEAPKLEMPKFEAPKLEAPKVETPAPSIKLPEPPVSVPEISPPAAVESLPVPEVPAADVQEFVTSAGSKLSTNDLKAMQESMQNGNAAVPDSITGGSDVLGSASSAVSGAVSSAGEAVSGATGAASAAIDAFFGGVRREIEIEKQSVTDGVNNLVPKSLPEVPEIPLPPALQQSLDSVSSTIGGVQAQFNEAPLGYTILASLTFGVPLYVYTTTQFGGFAGTYRAEDLAYRLQTEDNILVVDIRSLEALEGNGVLDLRMSARGKAESMPFAEIPRGMGQRVKNKAELAIQVNAAIICGLTPVNSFTKLVVMDSSGGSRAKQIAREISSQGNQGYVAQGGFAAWQAAGLDVKKGMSYTVTAVDKLADRSEELQKSAQVSIGAISESLEGPAGKVALSAVVLATLLAVWKPHEALQFVGFTGLELTALIYLLQYDSPQAAVDALAGTLAKAADAIPAGEKSVGDRINAVSRTARSPPPGRKKGSKTQDKENANSQ